MIFKKIKEDERVWNAGTEICTGRQWSVILVQAVGTTTVCRQGFGTTDTLKWRELICGERRKMVQKEVRQSDEETCSAIAVPLRLQGTCTKWSTTERNYYLKRFWSMNRSRSNCAIFKIYDTTSVYDIPSSPANLKRCELVEDHKLPTMWKEWQDGTCTISLPGIVLSHSRDADE